MAMPTRIVELDHQAARAHLLLGSSYFRDDLPSYLSFEPMIAEVESALGGKTFQDFKKASPSDIFGVNYEFMTV